MEFQHLVRKIKPLSLKEIGTLGWVEQHELLEKLNVQARKCIVNQEHDIISDELMSEAKVTTIAKNLLVHEQWRLNVYPALESSVSEGDESTLVYFSVFHEATLLSLLEILFFNSDAVKDCEDLLVDLVDYCGKWLVYLRDSKKIAPSDLKQNQTESLKTRIETLRSELGFKSLAVLRFITDIVDKLDISVLRKMLYTHDVICTCVQLMERKSWECRKDGKLFKFDDGAWRVFKSNEEMLLSKTECQVWIILYNLMVDPSCRQVYHWTNSRKKIAEKLRQHFNSTLMDQIPVLNLLHRVLEESLMAASSQETFPFIEEVNEKWNEKDFEEALEEFESKSLNMASSRVHAIMKRLSSVYDMDAIDDILPGVPTCASCGEVAVNRCSRCKNEWYCGRPCQVKAWKEHKALCDLLQNKEK